MKDAALALIPARGGSKRVPGKNKRLLAGKPVIQYSIEQAMQASEIDHVVVSTDDEGIAEIARQCNCDVIIRPAELATDHAKILDVIIHALDVLKEQGKDFAYVVMLQPAVPIREVASIDEAVRLLRSTQCDSVISHIRVDYFHPNRMKKIVDGNKVIPYCEEEIEFVPRRELPEAYYRDGAIYAMKASLPVEQQTVFGTDVRAVLNDRKWAVNIDEEKDWYMAEILMEKWLEIHYQP